MSCRDTKGTIEKVYAEKFLGSGRRIGRGTFLESEAKLLLSSGADTKNAVNRGELLDV
jgi:hypothetical protein